MDRARTTGPWALLPTRADWRAAHAHPRRDLVAGLTVAIVALPLALAFGVSSGLGAQAGLVTAVVAGVLAAVFGGSNLQVSGPTGAMTVVLIPVVHRFGASGVLTVGLLAGAILVVLAFARVGGLVRLLPMPVIGGSPPGSRSSSPCSSCRRRSASTAGSTSTSGPQRPRRSPVSSPCPAGRPSRWPAGWPH